jgi:hypothetical protein
MSWAYEGKKLKEGVNYLSWLPPWQYTAGEENDEFRNRLLGKNSQSEDRIGLGRIPMYWYTQNCAYNSAHDIHRFNVYDPLAGEALTDEQDRFRQVRYNFIQNRPSTASYIIALRAELNMRLVMRSVVPHSQEVPFLAMQRFECGALGANPHHHGFAVGCGNPRLDIMPEEELAKADAEVSAGNKPATEPAEPEHRAADVEAPGAETDSAFSSEEESLPGDPIGEGAAQEKSHDVASCQSVTALGRSESMASTLILEEDEQRATLKEKEAEFWKFSIAP